MSRVKQVSVVVVAILAFALLFVGVERGWFAAEPTSGGKTVTEWLDHLVLYEYQTNSADISMIPRAPEDLATDPAVAAIVRIGAKATPILVERIQERAHWDPTDSGAHRAVLWIRWAWDRIRHTATSPPAPESWSDFQRARKNAAAFALLALGTNAYAGFGRLMEVYADARATDRPVILAQTLHATATRHTVRGWSGELECRIGCRRALPGGCA